MAQDKSPKVVPRLKNYHFSEETGFILPEPLVQLPEYFEPWNKLSRELADLLRNHKLRTAVDQMPELDASLLTGHRQLRLAHTILSFVSNGYIRQEGDENIPKVLPRQLAVPWYSISQRLGMKPCVCFSALVLSNCIHLDRSKPLALGNMKLICKISDEEPFRWFCGVFLQTELDSVAGIKALLGAMDAVLENDIEKVCNSLDVVASTIRTLTTTTMRVHEKIPGDYFLPKIAPLVSGYGGNATKFPEGIIFEGISDTPITAASGSGGQSSAVQCFDVGLGIDHGDAQNRLSELRTYMPPAHANFIRALAQGPSIKDYVESSEDNRLKEVYADCLSAFRDFRSSHIQIATKYVVIPSQKTNGELHTNGKARTNGETIETGLMPFLKSVRDTTK